MRNSHGQVDNPHALYLPKGESSFPYKYNKIIKNSTFLLSFAFIDLSGAHSHRKIKGAPFLTSLTSHRVQNNLRSQFEARGNVVS